MCFTNETEEHYGTTKVFKHETGSEGTEPAVGVGAETMQAGQVAYRCRSETIPHYNGKVVQK